MELVVRPRTLKFRTPFGTAGATVRTREILEVDLVDGDEVVGRGEAAPLEFYDGVPLDRVADVLARYARVLEGRRDTPGPEILEACAHIDPLPQALAAIDIALWDRGGRSAGRPIAELLSNTAAPCVPVNATVAAVAVADVTAACIAAREATYSCVKLKVGLPDDMARVRAARDALGCDVALRLDANGAWTVEEAVSAIEALAVFDPEYVEEPVHGIDALRAVRDRVSVPLAMDETTSEPGALASQATDAVGLKLSGCGGISGLLAAATLVRAYGGVAYVTSTLDGPRGIAAAVHAACALAPLPACGLATLGLFTDVWPSLTAQAGAMTVPVGAGLGLS